MNHVCNDVLRIILLLLADERTVLRCSGVCRRWRRLLESARTCWQASSWSWQRFARLRELRVAGHWFVHYEGYEAATMWENYKMETAQRMLLRVRIGGDPQRTHRVGVVYTWDQWQHTHQMLGPVMGDDDDAGHAPTRPRMQDYRVARGGDAANDAHDYDAQRYSDDEEQWFFSDEHNGRPQAVVSARGARPTEWLFTFNCWYQLYEPDSNCHALRFGRDTLWFALFAEDVHGARVWDNNAHWNYTARIPYCLEKRESARTLGLLGESNHGWRGT